MHIQTFLVNFFEFLLLLPVTHSADKPVCAGYSRNLFRTFDGLIYRFSSNDHCSYVVFNDGMHSLTLRLEKCDLVPTCKKVNGTSTLCQ